MGFYAILLAFILYLTVGVSNLRQKDYPMALVWFAYALSQIGFAWYEWKKLHNG